MSLRNSDERVQVIVSTFFLVDEYTSSVKRKTENRAIKFEELSFSGRFVMYWDMMYLRFLKVLPLTASTNFVTE